MKISPVSRSRISSINSPSYSGGARAVDRTQDAQKVDNYSQSLNFEFDKENFYDKLDSHRKSNSKDTFQREKNDKKNNIPYEFSKEEKELIQNIKNILSNINNRIDTIKSVDIARKENNIQKIKKVYRDNSKFLASIGIYTDKLFHFSLRDEDFARAILLNPTKLNQLTDPINGILKKIVVALTL